MHVRGSATAFRLYDIGYAIDLEAVASLIREAARGRARPARIEARAFLIPNPPLSLALGEQQVRIDGELHTARVSAHLFDFGICSLRLSVDAPGEQPWSDFAAFGMAFERSPDIAETLHATVGTLLERIRPAVQRPAIAPVVEDYVVYRVDELRDDAGQAGNPATMLGDTALVQLLLGETRPLSADARRELLSNRFSYYEDDLAVLTWDNALVVEPRREDRDVELVLEFANAQLLELRLYDAQLDQELPPLFERTATRRRMPHFTGAFRRLLGQVQSRVAELTELVERADNAFKVTDDVYLARIYGAALEIFRERAWRLGVDRKLGILRETYSMLNAEAQVARAEAMELIIVLLIAFEVVMGLVR